MKLLTVLDSSTIRFLSKCPNGILSARIHLYNPIITLLHLLLCHESTLSLNKQPTVRHLCLIDLISNSKDNYDLILSQVNTISLGYDRIWLEGYSYWLYTRKILGFYCDYILKPVGLVSIINQIDRRFFKLSYIGKDGNFYPPPFGDLRFEPIQDGYLIEKYKPKHYPSSENAIISKQNDRYFIKKHLLGFNTHIPDKDLIIDIVDGLPFVRFENNVKVDKPFTFYTGFENKYQSKREERKDTFNFQRIKSAIGYK